ncbi:Outer membrane protein/peptidoglycan-associated (Lipo)protein [Paraburkholderia ribeironis]|uniref:Outer membrane protein/peptidoglycan-associated (Lipo)protein n=1 Tax=Paraburkholderia ribeironis TaxID=1247936 RepID=A0A1N7SEE5_9BURK|nr:OmpA family protein [Paraburkholderia ribeironis]SIT45756.1 Outer membrane protein/peptidoglycan-associated (Lipo)protein [Paraburkholderia ribeironis]
MKYSLIAIALAAMLAGCSSSATRDHLQIQDPTVLQTGFNATQNQAAGAVTSQWIATYGGVKNAAMLRSLNARLTALGERKNNYFGDKAQCWLDAARDERSLHDGWGFVEEALVESNRLTTALETGQGLSVENPELRTVSVIRPDLWKQVLAAKTSPLFPQCQEAQRLTACSEVELMHAGHEAWTRDFDESQRLVDGVEKGLPAIGAALQACTPPPVAGVTTIPPKVTLQADATFRFDRGDMAGILPSGKAKLDQLLHDLNQVDDVTGIRVEGYTDRLGSDSYNRQLSARRAETVKRYLQNGGVKTPITARGRGKENPLVQCNDRNRQALIDCLAPNRRVELDFARSNAQTSVAPQGQRMQSQRPLQDQQGE